MNSAAPHNSLKFSLRVAILSMSRAAIRSCTTPVASAAGLVCNRCHSWTKSRIKPRELAEGYRRRHCAIFRSVVYAGAKRRNSNANQRKGISLFQVERPWQQYASGQKLHCDRYVQSQQWNWLPIKRSFINKPAIASFRQPKDHSTSCLIDCPLRWRSDRARMKIGEFVAEITYCIDAS